MNRPSNELLHSAAPLDVWEEAIRQARRSPMIRFKVGAVIWDPVNKSIISTGCSHPDVSRSKQYSSIHAEIHALRRGNYRNLKAAWCLIFTANRRGNCTYTSRPCIRCANRLYHQGVERILYPERTKVGWTIQVVHPEELVAKISYVAGPYARQQRIPL